MFTTSLLRSSIAGPSRIAASRSPRPARLPVSSPPFAVQPRSPFPSATRAPGIRSFSSTSASADKLKSHSGTKKRFFRTASGLFKRAQAGKQHLNTLFSASRINRLGKTAYTTKTQNTMLRKLLPYA